MTYREAIDILIAHATEFYRLGWMLGTGGNMSIRTDEGFVITASGRHKGELTPDDFVRCDMEGCTREGDPAPSAETSIHLAVYRDYPDAVAVYHVHDVHAALCSERDAARGATTFKGLEMLKGLGVQPDYGAVDVPIFPNHDNVAEIAMDVESYLSDRPRPMVPGLNVRGHGVYAWGDSPSAARRHLECFAYLFEYSWKAG
ncbi:MAG: methylthioribulose 1-phosphate dehydratase [Myxococcota bacterium]